jgi:cyclopropane-fatty-acyl-phospholipid synthase
MAQQRCEGLDVNILLQDYRDLNKHYDRIVSVGMFEHVGPKNYDTYFSIADRCLKPDGLFLLHTIGSNKKGMSVDPWINKYIFPNGCLPAISHIAEASESRFVMEDWHNFGSDYDKTLMAWHERFNQAWPELSSRYSATFRRMFNYYLCACAGLSAPEILSFGRCCLAAARADPRLSLTSAGCRRCLIRPTKLCTRRPDKRSASGTYGLSQLTLPAL